MKHQYYKSSNTPKQGKVKKFIQSLWQSTIQNQSNPQHLKQQFEHFLHNNLEHIGLVVRMSVSGYRG